MPIEYPCIEIAPPEDTAPLDSALRELAAGHFDWLLLTSANTVFVLRQRLNALGISLDNAAFQTAAVGPVTDRAARQIGLDPVSLPEEYSAEALADAMLDVRGARVLIPASALARPSLAETLARRGADVVTVCAYRTVRGQGWADRIMEAALQVCPDKDVVLDAQSPLADWYAALGFEVLPG